MTLRRSGAEFILRASLFDRVADAARTLGPLDARACCRRGVCPLVVAALFRGSAEGSQAGKDRAP